MPWAGPRQKLVVERLVEGSCTSFDVPVGQPGLLALLLVDSALGRLVADISDELVVVADVLLIFMITVMISSRSSRS